MFSSFSGEFDFLVTGWGSVLQFGFGWGPVLVCALRNSYCVICGGFDLGLLFVINGSNVYIFFIN